MRIVKLSSLLRSVGVKIPETQWKEDIVRFLVEAKSERIVEIPVVLNNIPQRKSTILDVGCRYSLLSIQLASMGHKVFGLDINGYKHKHPNFRFTQGDILRPPFKRTSFDLVISLSTIEHIGLGAYGESEKDGGDFEAAKSIYSLLKKGGSFLLTVPFGMPATTEFQRVYDTKRLKELLRMFRIKEFETFISKKGFWLPSDPATAEKVNSSEVSHALAFVLASKP